MATTETTPTQPQKLDGKALADDKTNEQVSAVLLLYMLFLCNQFSFKQPQTVKTLLVYLETIRVDAMIGQTHAITARWRKAENKCFVDGGILAGFQRFNNNRNRVYVSFRKHVLLFSSRL